MQVTDCEALRRELKPIADKVAALASSAIKTGAPSVAEAVENAILAYRHLEDASMRLGKAIQALDGGVSVYDRTQVPTSGG
jgi:hypothetical protein